MSDATPRAAAGWLIPAGIYVVAVVLYVLLGTRHEVPLIFPDEMNYATLARSVADGEGIGRYGADETWPLALYIYLLAPSWLIASGESAYEIAKITGALLVCTVVFPVWLLASRLLSPLRAAVPVALTVAGTWMLSSAGLLTENLALPLSSAALACAVVALAGTPASRWGLAALVFAALATVTRAQMGVLFAVMLAALLLYAAMAENPRACLQRHRRALVVLGAIVAAGTFVVLAGPTGVLGSYAEVGGYTPALGDLVSKAAEQWIALAVTSGVLPLAALLVLIAQRGAWRDRDVGPLLSVSAAAVAVLLIESAFFIAGNEGGRIAGNEGGLPWTIERYVEYCVPLLLVLLFVAVDRRLLPLRWFGLASAGVALSLLASPEVRQAVEQRATYATSKLIGGVLDLDIGPALTIGALLVAGVGTLLVARLPGPRAVYAVGGLLLATFALQSQWVWRWQLDFTDQIRAQFPADMEWVDTNARGPVTRLYVNYSSYLFPRADVFNDRIEQVLTSPNPRAGPPALGSRCTWMPDARGVLQVVGGCGPVKSRIWNDDTFNRTTFYGGRTLARDDALGEIIAVPPNPRLRSVIRLPCPAVPLGIGRDGALAKVPNDFPCLPFMRVFLWLDSPRTLELTFKGGSRAQDVRFGKRSWTIPARERTTIKIPVRSAFQQLTLLTDWNRDVGTQLVDAALVSDGQREPLL